MRFATIPWQESTSAALVSGDAVAVVRDLPGRDDARDVLALIHRPLTDDERSDLSTCGVPISTATWRSPILRPPKNVLCVGKNYVEHVHEGARAEGQAAGEIPAAPIWFSKAATALLGCGGEIEHDATFTSCLDYEGELAVVIGDTCRRVSAEDAYEHIFGYTILNDVTARDVQQGRKQWLRGKSADTYAPCGPWVVTPDEVGDPQHLSLTTTVNGVVRQNDDTANMIFDIATLIADISVGMTLHAGDIIATGTPSGVAWGMDEPAYLLPGDEVVVEVENIGRLWNRVVSVSG